MGDGAATKKSRGSRRDEESVGCEPSDGPRVRIPLARSRARPGALHVHVSLERSAILATDFFSGAPWHVGIRHAEALIVHGLFALFARHVPAANDVSLCAPGI